MTQRQLNIIEPAGKPLGPVPPPRIVIAKPLKDECENCGGVMEPHPDMWHEGWYRCRDCSHTEVR